MCGYLVLQALEGGVCELNVSGLTSCMAGLASLRMWPRELMEELQSKSAHAIRKHECTLSEVAILMKSFAQLQRAAPDLCQAVVEHEQHLARHRKLDAQSRVMLVWAMLALSMSTATALRTQQEQALYGLAPSHGMSDTALLQLFQVC
jgi:thioesterase domain-containing protein